MADVTVTPTVELGGTVPRVRLDVVDANIPERFAASVVRHDPDGRVVPVRTPDGEALVLQTSGVTRVGLVYDYEAPYGEPVTYSTLESPAIVSAPVTVAETRVWLNHPGVPELSRPVVVQEFGARARPIPQGVFMPLGRREPIVHTDGQRKAASFSLSLLTQTEEEARLLEPLLEDGSALLLNVPATSGYGVPTEYVSIGEVTVSRVARYAGNPLRLWQMQCTVTARPVGGTQAERTWVDVIANYATWADVMNAYESWFDVLAGP